MMNQNSRGAVDTPSAQVAAAATSPIRSRPPCRRCRPRRKENEWRRDGQDARQRAERDETVNTGRSRGMADAGLSCRGLSLGKVRFRRNRSCIRSTVRGMRSRPSSSRQARVAVAAPPLRNRSERPASSFAQPAQGFRIVDVVPFRKHVAFDPALAARSACASATVVGAPGNVDEQPRCGHVMPIR